MSISTGLGQHRATLPQVIEKQTQESDLKSVFAKAECGFKSRRRQSDL